MSLVDVAILDFLLWKCCMFCQNTKDRSDQDKQLATTWNLIQARDSTKIGFWTFHHNESCGISSLSVPRMWRRFGFGFVMDQDFLGYFICLNSTFDLLVPARGHFLPFCATPINFRPRTWVAHEATTALNSCHSTSASAVHSEISTNKHDTLSAKVFLHLFRQGLQLSDRPGPAPSCKPWLFSQT